MPLFTMRHWKLRDNAVILLAQPDCIQNKQVLSIDNAKQSTRISSQSSTSPGRKNDKAMRLLALVFGLDMASNVIHFSRK